MLEAHPDLVALEWPGPDKQGKPFVKGSTALHYAANDGKLRLVHRLIDLGADVNASNACWFRSALSGAANNARVETLRLRLDRGADVHALDALHAATWGGSACGKGKERQYAESLEILPDMTTPLSLKSLHWTPPIAKQPHRPSWLFIPAMNVASSAAARPAR